MKTKKCCKCKIDKDLKHFSINKSKKDGFNPSCRDCHNKYTKQHYLNNKEYYKKKAKQSSKENNGLKDWYFGLKKTLKCEKCEENHPACLDFHHIDNNSKLMTVAQMYQLNFTKEKIIEEIDKCTVLCSNCHRKLHLSSIYDR